LESSPGLPQGRRGQRKAGREVLRSNPWVREGMEPGGGVGLWMTPRAKNHFSTGCLGLSACKPRDRTKWFKDSPSRYGWLSVIKKDKCFMTAKALSKFEAYKNF
jgi:hypothetical protein